MDSDLESVVSHDFNVDYHSLRFKRELGRGTFGVVRLAVWQGDKFAVKALQRIEEKEEVLRKEFELVKNLRSPRIIQVHGTTVDPETRKLCVIMEYASGGSLRQALDNDGLPETREQLQWALDIAQGMAFLHQNHITHCDLKGPNVLLDEHRRGKVADFGLSMHHVETPSGNVDGTVTTTIKGSPPWMAPEAIKGQRKMASDLYAFAVVLWEIRTAQAPWKGVPFVSILYKVAVEHERPPLPEGEHFFDALMKELWEEEEHQRPSFDECVERLEGARVRLFGISFQPSSFQPSSLGQ